MDVLCVLSLQVLLLVFWFDFRFLLRVLFSWFCFGGYDIAVIVVFAGLRDLVGCCCSMVSVVLLFFGLFDLCGFGVCGFVLLLSWVGGLVFWCFGCLCLLGLLVCLRLIVVVCVFVCLLLDWCFVLILGFLVV